MLSMETHGCESQVWSKLLIGQPDSGGQGLAVAAAVSVSQASVPASEEEDQRKSRADFYTNSPGFWSRSMQRLNVTSDGFPSYSVCRHFHFTTSIISLTVLSP